MTDVANAGGISNDRLFCQEQVHKTNRLFRVSRVFAAAEESPHLLPLYALFSVVEEICSLTVDADVARYKLEWWRMECLARGPGDSDHPVLKELGRSGAAERLEPGVVAELLDSAAARLDAPAPGSLAELQQLCLEVGRPQLRLEARLSATAPVGTEAIHGACARNGLAQLLRESSRSPAERRFWWVPLELLARHGIARRQIAEVGHGTQARAIFEELLHDASGWGDERGVAEPLPTRHLHVVARLNEARIRRLGKRTPAEFAGTWQEPVWHDLYQAWRAAREFNRR